MGVDGRYGMHDFFHIERENVLYQFCAGTNINTHCEKKVTTTITASSAQLASERFFYVQCTCEVTSV